MTTTTTTRVGFYGTDEHTCYVTPSGKVYCVQTVDLIETPVKWDSLPDDFKPCDDLISPDERDSFLSTISAEYGDRATA